MHQGDEDSHNGFELCPHCRLLTSMKIVLAAMLRSNRSCSRVARLARLQDVATTNAPRAVRCLHHLPTRN